MKAITLFTLLFCLQSYASVGVLNQGTCWWEQSGDYLKLANFSSSEAHEFSINDLLRKQKENLLGQGIEALDLQKLALWCSASDMFLVSVFKKGEKSFCLWSKFKSREIILSSFGRLEESGAEICHGVEMSRFLLKSKKDLHAELSKRQELGVVESFERIGSERYLVELSALTLEDLSKAREELSSLGDLEESFYHHPIGEGVSLKGP